MNGIREWQVSKDEIGFFNGLQKITGGKKRKHEWNWRKVIII